VLKFSHRVDMATSEKFVNEVPNPLERDEGRETVEALCAENSRLKEELQRLQADQSNPRVSSFSSLDSFETGPQWIRAELDCPGDTTRYLFFGQRRSKYRRVVVYDPSRSCLESKRRSDMKGEHSIPRNSDSRLTPRTDSPGGIYSRFPSRLSGIVYVFVECATTAAPRKFRISSNKETPFGFSLYCTIHLKRLSWRTRVKIWTGRIKWLYILRDPDSRANSPSNQQLEE